MKSIVSAARIIAENFNTYVAMVLGFKTKANTIIQHTLVLFCARWPLTLIYSLLDIVLL
jgi:hypothetical protein